MFTQLLMVWRPAILRLREMLWSYRMKSSERNYVGGTEMAYAKYQKSSQTEVVTGEAVMAKQDPRDEAFSRALASTVKEHLKPDFDRIDSHLTKLDTHFSTLETSNRDIQTKLSQIIKKLG